jgi:hypothetical protein
MLCVNTGAGTREPVNPWLGSGTTSHSPCPPHASVSGRGRSSTPLEFCLRGAGTCLFPRPHARTAPYRTAGHPPEDISEQYAYNTSLTLEQLTERKAAADHTVGTYKSKVAADLEQVGKHEPCVCVP